MRLLVLGGTAWLGRRTAELARDAGHEVTCLARGESGDVPDGVRLVSADRAEAGAYDGLTGEWDAAVEVSWQPRFVREAVAALGDRVGHWVYVSSVSVYADVAEPGVGAARHPAYAGDEPAGIEDYGPAKVACEDAYAALAPGASLLVRAGLIGGGGDGSDRFGYWPARVARAVEALGPAAPMLLPPPDAPFQVLDVDDLAAFLVDAAERRAPGVVDAVGDVARIGELVATCVEVLGGDAASAPPVVAATEEELAAHGVRPWSGPDSLPLWIPGAALLRDPAGARAAGLAVRPLAATVEATLAWERSLGLTRPRRSGLTPEREAEVLAALTKGRSKSPLKG